MRRKGIVLAFGGENNAVHEDRGSRSRRRPKCCIRDYTGRRPERETRVDSRCPAHKLGLCLWSALRISDLSVILVQPHFRRLPRCPELVLRAPRIPVLWLVGMGAGIRVLRPKNATATVTYLSLWRRNVALWYCPSGPCPNQTAPRYSC